MRTNWKICGRCGGEGRHSHAIGAITGADRADWSDDELSSYMAGGLSETCEACEGTGKVAVSTTDEA
jgi:hypothetical protein